MIKTMEPDSIPDRGTKTLQAMQQKKKKKKKKKSMEDTPKHVQGVIIWSKIVIWEHTANGTLRGRSHRSSHHRNDSEICSE